MNNLRTNLKYFRISANLRQEDLSEKVELTDKYISDLERAKFSLSLETIEKLVHALNISIDLLLKEEKNLKICITRIDKKTGTRKREKIIQKEKNNFLFLITLFFINVYYLGFTSYLVYF